MKRIHIFLGVFILWALLAACGDSSGGELTYRAASKGASSITYTSETGKTESVTKFLPWETSFNIGSSFDFSLRVENTIDNGIPVKCEVWINGELIGSATGGQFAECSGSFSGNPDSSSTSFISHSGEFESETVVEDTAVPPTPEPTTPPTEEPALTPTETAVNAAETTPADIKAASVAEAAALGDIFGLNNVAWSPDGAQLATSEKGAVQLWQFNPDDGTPLQSLRLLPAPTEKRIESLTWSPDGAFVVGGSVDGVWVWEAATGELAAELPHEYGARSFSWSPDGSILASSSNDGYVRLWDAANNWQTATLTQIQDTIRQVAWSPDGTLIATTEQYIVHLWDATSGEEVRTLAGHTDLVGHLAWSPDGRRLATTSDDQTVRIWDAATGVEELVLEHASYLTGIAWSPDGVILAASTGDDEIYLWNAQNSETLLTFTGLSDSATDLDWSSDGMYLAAASLYASEARVWQVHVEK